jgi:hypothetical protein
MYKIRFILSLIIAISTISMPTCANGMDIEIDYTLEDPLPLDVEEEEENTEEISLEEDTQTEEPAETTAETKSNNVISNFIEKAKEKSSSLVSTVEEKT